MTKQEIAIVKNEDKMHTTNVVCPLCNDEFHENNFKNHFISEHHFQIDDFKWRISKPKINISEDQILVSFPLMNETITSKSVSNLKQVIQTYYDGLYERYKRAGGEIDSVSVQNFITNVNTKKNSSEEKALMAGLHYYPKFAFLCHLCNYHSGLPKFLIHMKRNHPDVNIDDLDVELSSVRNFPNNSKAFFSVIEKNLESTNYTFESVVQKRIEFLTTGIDGLLEGAKIKRERLKKAEIEDKKRLAKEQIELKKLRLAQKLDEDKMEKERAEEKKLRLRLENSDHINLIWDNIIFDRNRIKFQHKDYYILPVDCSGIVPQLNNIKNSYFNKEHKIILKFYVYKGNVEKEHSPGWQKLMDIIDLAKVSLDSQILNAANKAFTLPEISGYSNEQIIEKYAGINKSYFIKLLSGLQHSKFKIVPIIEHRNTLNEVSFIFSLVAKSSVLLIWENCSENRGTHIFKTTSSDYQKTLANLKSYIQDPDIVNKRKTLWQYDEESKEVKNMLKDFLSLRHHDKLSFRNQLQELLSN